MKDYLKIAVFAKNNYTWYYSDKQDRNLMKRRGKARVKQADKKSFQEILKKGLDK